MEMIHHQDIESERVDQLETKAREAVNSVTAAEQAVAEAQQAVEHAKKVASDSLIEASLARSAFNKKWA